MKSFATRSPQWRKELAREKSIKKIDELARAIELKGGFDVDYWVERVLSRLGVRAREQKIGTL